MCVFFWYGSTSKFGCTNAIVAPNQDWDFLKDSIAYAYIDSEVSTTLLRKLKNHLWWCTVALAFFDSNVFLGEKPTMVERLESKDPIVQLVQGRTLQSPNFILIHNLSDFVSHKTKKLYYHRQHFRSSTIYMGIRSRLPRSSFFLSWFIRR